MLNARNRTSPNNSASAPSTDLVTLCLKITSAMILMCFLKASACSNSFLTITVAVSDKLFVLYLMVNDLVLLSLTIFAHVGSPYLRFAPNLCHRAVLPFGLLSCAGQDFPASCIFSYLCKFSSFISNVYKFSSISSPTCASLVPSRTCASSVEFRLLPAQVK